jgi:putative hydrolase
MKTIDMIAIDTHTHSLASSHAYSSLEEMARAAHKKGLTGFILTDHSPGMPGGAHLFHFYNLRVLPREIHGTLVFRGAEANIINSSGEIDLDEEVMEHLEVVIASFHIHFSSRVGETDHCQALLEELQFPSELIANATLERFLSVTGLSL